MFSRDSARQVLNITFWRQWNSVRAMTVRIIKNEYLFCYRSEDLIYSLYQLIISWNNRKTFYFNSLFIRKDKEKLKVFNCLYFDSRAGPWVAIKLIPTWEDILFEMKTALRRRHWRQNVPLYYAIFITKYLTVSNKQTNRRDLFLQSQIRSCLWDGNLWKLV